MRSHCTSFKVPYLNDLTFVGSSVYLFTLSNCWKSVCWNATSCSNLPLSDLCLCKGKYRNPIFTGVPLSEVSVACGQLWFENIRLENSRDKQFTSFKFYTILNGMLIFCTVSPHPTRDTVLICLVFSHCQRKNKSGLKLNHNVVDQI